MTSATEQNRQSIFKFNCFVTVDTIVAVRLPIFATLITYVKRSRI